MKKITNYSYDILSGFPQTNEKIISFGGQPSYSEGLIVRLAKHDSESWIANFKKGFKKDVLIHNLSNTDLLVVIAYGNGYLVNLKSQELLQEFGHGYLNHAAICGDGSLIVFDLTSALIVDSNGNIWTSERISWDDFKEVKIEGEIVRGYSYDPTSKEDMWVPFAINIKTREIVGGSYRQSMSKI